jgi:hypothetical protein
VNACVRQLHGRIPKRHVAVEVGRRQFSIDPEIESTDDETPIMNAHGGSAIERSGSPLLGFLIMRLR